ncbi:hypothetical protein GCM10027515_31270 [Schumannella luteola]|uniref:Uncharacterized protein n=1 Tax=Schumannella luteola TaxID=472059 RepID=A0A852YB54_9MICO|nr:hypothetical protein [Schumannella luteola]NYG99072.1 hypothetical protein [Schumannella luteola]TPX06423.1 hypothetical protein FJ656_01980 [Schumannella luteola]
MTDAAETFEQLVNRLAATHPRVFPGRIAGILFEEHDLLVGTPAGDIIGPTVVDAVAERVAREQSRVERRRGRAAGDHPAADQD